MDYEAITFNDFSWFNEPKEWQINNNKLTVKAERDTRFWRDPFKRLIDGNNGHFFRIQVKEDFELQVCVEAEFNNNFDEAGVMIYSHEKHWIKAGMEYAEGQPMVSSVVTNEISDWGTGLYTGDPRKFWIKLTKIDDVVRIRFSMDKSKWYLLRFSPFVVTGDVYVGTVCCTVKTAGLKVNFSELSISKHEEHENMP